MDQQQELQSTSQDSISEGTEQQQQQPQPQPQPQQQQPQQPEEEHFSLQSILLAGITLATANAAIQQLRGLTIIHSIASGSDEGIKTELGKAGIFTLASRILNGGIATPGSSSNTFWRARKLATAIIWIASIAHAENKIKGTVGMLPLIKQLSYFLPCLEKRELKGNETTSNEGDNDLEGDVPENLKDEIRDLRENIDLKEKEDLIQYTGRALWSLCYGIPANQQLLLAHKGVHLLIRVLKLQHPEVHWETRYTAAGALWHAAMQPEAASTIVRLSGAPALIELSKSEQPATETFVPCLTLSTLLNHSAPDCIGTLKENGALEAIGSWVRANDVLNFKSPFVWTTLKPLVSLLESKFTQVNELGCFMTAAEVCNKSEISKMFSEGVVSQLEQFALANGDINIESFNQREHDDEGSLMNDGRRCSKLTSYLALLALSRLQIDTSQLKQRALAQPSTSSPSNSFPFPSTQDTSAITLQSWLKSLGLEELEEVLTKNEVNFDNIAYLEEKDLEDKLRLPLGPLRKLANAIRSLRLYRNIPIITPTTTTTTTTPGPTPTPCLICMDGDEAKDMCFVPCGHVAVCESCSQIMRARKDPCLVCRAPVESFIKLYFT